MASLPLFVDNSGQNGMLLHQNSLFVDNPGLDAIFLHQNSLFVDNCAVESVLRRRKYVYLQVMGIFRFYNDNPIGTSRPINRCGRSIFQYINTFNFFVIKVL